MGKKQSNSNIKKVKKLTKLELFLNSHKLISAIIGVLGAIIIISVAGFLNARYPLFNRQNTQQQKEYNTPQLSLNEPDFDVWGVEKTGQIIPQTRDDDNDGLTNLEEFKLGTDPKNSNTCSPDKTDGQNLLELINPLTCQKIDLNNPEEEEKFGSLIEFDNIKQSLISNINQTSKPNSNTNNSGLLATFGVSSYQDLENYDTSKIDNELKIIEQKKRDLNAINKIKNYISKYRSFESFDRGYESPVSAAKYLEVSQNYNVPLKYILAMAQLESRFGTDRYDANGNQNRIGRYKNIYSIGLSSTDSMGFETWEQGVEAFGKWYKYFQDRGVGDCQKWRIFNRNGDYCSKVENQADTIDRFLNS